MPNFYGEIVDVLDAQLTSIGRVKTNIYLLNKIDHETSQPTPTYRIIYNGKSYRATTKNEVIGLLLNDLVSE